MATSEKVEIVTESYVIKLSSEEFHILDKTLGNIDSKIGRSLDLTDEQVRTLDEIYEAL